MLSPEEDTFDKIEKNNPYKIDEESMIPEGLVRQAFLLQRKAYLVKFLSILDFVSNIIYGFYGYVIYIIFAGCSYAGYLSTVTYNKYLLLCYLMYQFLQIIFKSLSFILVIAFGCSSDLRHQIDNYTNVTNDFDLDNVNYGLAIPLSGFLLILQIFITIFIYDFYKCLPTRHEIQHLLV